MTKEEKQYSKMTTCPTKKLVISLGLPTTISMLVTAIYNIADTLFVSRLGTSASGAVGVVFSLMAVVQAVGFTFGMGSSSLISSKLGEKRDKEAQIYGSSSFYIAILIGLIISIVTFSCLGPLMSLLGATPTVLPYAKSYAFYIAFGFPVMIGSFVLNNILRSEGKAKLSMIGLTTGGILNIILDPIFIYQLELGISGAAIATLISQSISFIILLSMFIAKKSIIKLSIKDISSELRIYGDIIKVGFPSLCRQGLASIATIFLNTQAGRYGGDPALSAMSIVSKVFMVIFSVSLGIGQGYQPVCGYNYFANRFDRVKEAMIFTFICGTVIMTVSCVLFYVFAENVMNFFIEDIEVIKIGTKALRYQCISLPFLSLNVICNMSFQSTRQKIKATILSACRQGLFFIPLIFILPAILDINGNGILGVELTQAASDFLTFLFTIPFYIGFVRELNKKAKAQEENKMQLYEYE